MNRLDSQPAGLTSEEVRSRLLREGPNALPRRAAESPLAVLWRQINTPLIWVLLAAAGLAVALGKVTDGLIVLAVVFANTLIGFIQEYRAARALEALVSMVPEHVNVIRDSRHVSISAMDLVSGDVVLIAGGDKVAADMRLLDVKHLQVDEAALTGESLPVTKQVAAVPAGAALGDRTSMVFGGTFVVAGTGTAVVCATGARSELGAFLHCSTKRRLYRRRSRRRSPESAIKSRSLS
jgi:Ca2+-transporting ATPase